MLALTVSHGEVDVQHANKLRVALNHIADALPGEGLLPESSLDLLQDLGVARACLVQHWSE